MGRNGDLIVAESTDARARRMLLIGVLPALFLPLLGTVLYTTLPRDSVLVGVAYAVTKGITLLWVPVFALLEGWRPRLQRANWRTHVRSLPLGVATGLAIGGLLWACFLWTPLGDAVRARGPEVRTFVTKLGILEHYLAFSIMISAAHSLWEEVYWRWFVFGCLRKLMKRAWPAYVLGSVMFASHHFVVLRSYFPLGLTLLCSLGVAVGGALWCWMLERQSTLVGAWLSHGLVDAAFLAIGYLVLGL